ncbi:MAG: hypothetical protein KA981_09770 [Bacteroidia bacterium]|nr:hypothetical protein [Bacteroidia bacterium]
MKNIETGNKMITKKPVPFSNNEYRQISIIDVVKIGRAKCVKYIVLNKITGELTGHIGLLNLSTINKEYKTL